MDEFNQIEEENEGPPVEYFSRSYPFSEKKILSTLNEHHEENKI
jgi:hypothetical protein